MTEHAISPESIVDKETMESITSQQKEEEESMSRESLDSGGVSKIRLISLLVGIGFAGLAGALVSRHPAWLDTWTLSNLFALG